MTDQKHVTPSLTAFHEAAHAVARIRLGGSVYSVTLVPHEEASEGHMLPLGDDSSDADLCLVAPAGLAAKIVAGCERAVAEVGATCDLEYARTRLAEGESIGSCLARAARFVSDEWATIGLVAAALDKQRTLDGQLVERIMFGWETP